MNFIEEKKMLNRNVIIEENGAFTSKCYIPKI